MSVNLQQKQLKLDRLMKFYTQHTFGYNTFCSHGNSLFSSPHPLDFNKCILVIFSLKNIKQTWANILLCLLDDAYETPLANIKNGLPKVARKAFNIGEVWNLVCCHGNKCEARIVEHI